MNTIEIIKDKYLGQWVVWLRVSENLEIDIHKASTKKACKEWLKCIGKEILKNKA